MKQFIAAASAVLIAACGASETQQAAQNQADAITEAQVRAANDGQIPTGSTPLKGGGPGCKDRTEAGAIVVASKKDDPEEYLKLWADGMQDQSCRAFSEGLGVKVKEKAGDGWACIVADDDPDSPECFWIEPGRV